MDNYVSFTDVIIAESIREAVKVYGLEGYTEAVERCYKNNKIAKEKILSVFKNIYFPKNN